MGYRDSGYENRDVTPTEFTQLGEAMAATLWLQKQLSLLERIRPCKRTEYLRAVLTETLDQTPSQASDLAAVNANQAKEIERLKSELYKTEGEIRQFRELADSPEPSEEDASRSGWLRAIGIAFLAVIAWIAISHFFSNS